ncbi:putative protein N(5)-glutamine methyltransferase [Nocardia stercoris]|uniref:putative protein N(5)-glutamine methyltransferase n=1 Tax=Nocardia stercoris TaxID=2483361 RepID=UPI001F199831|nr:putative protein N(5)-glutamine methyltransferase [Nocardia stercoris]
MARLRAAGCVFAEDEARLLIEAAGFGDELDALVTQRVSGTPLEHLLGWAEFRGLRVRVGPGVFVPRQRTGWLVQVALTRAADTDRPLVVLDMCCGSGALGLAIGTELRAAGRAAQVWAADVEPAAVACARVNLAPFGGRVCAGDLFDALPAELAGRVDILAANTPYVPTDHIADMPPEARDHEPLSALDGGADGLDLARRVAAAAPHWLAPGGTVLVETSTAQAPVLAEVFTGHGLRAAIEYCDDLDATVVTGTRIPDSTG